MNMVKRLPRTLQVKFAAQASYLESKGQLFPTLTDFVNKHASIANHPVNYKPQQFNRSNPLKNKGTSPDEKTDLPKCLMNANDHGNTVKAPDKKTDTKCMMNVNNHGDPYKQPQKRSKGKTSTLPMRSIQGKDPARKDLPCVLKETVPKLS